MPPIGGAGQAPARSDAASSRGSSAQERSAALRKVLSRLWPQGNQADVLKRELVLLLLEDPDHRLRIAHCDDLMHSRLPGVYASTSNGHSPIRLAIAHDPLCQRIFCIDAAPLALPTVASLGTDWGRAMLRLNTAELTRCCAQIQDLSQHNGLLAALVTPCAPAGATLGAVEQVLLLAVSATWPQHDTDDEEYMATALAYVLASKQDPQLQLPPCSLHLSDLQGWLRVIARGDVRLARRCHTVGILGDAAPASTSGAAPPSVGKDAAKDQAKGEAAKEAAPSKKAGGSKAVASRMQELLAQPRFKGLLKMRDAAGARRGEKVVVLCVDKLAAPRPSAAAPEHMVRWMLAEASLAPGRPGVPGLAAVPQSAMPHAATNGHASPGLPKFLFEYEAPEGPSALHAMPPFPSPSAQRMGNGHVAGLSGLFDLGGGGSAAPGLLDAGPADGGGTHEAAAQHSPYSSGSSAVAVLSTGRPAATSASGIRMPDVQPSSCRGDIFDALAGSSPPGRINSTSPSTPSAAGPAAGLVPNYPAPGSSPTSQAGNTLFSTSPNMGLKHVPQAVANCWGGLMGAPQAHAHGQVLLQQQQQQQQAPSGIAPIGPSPSAPAVRKAGFVTGVDATGRAGPQPPPPVRSEQPSAVGDNMSPPSALDASFALMGGSHGSSGSHGGGGGGGGPDPVFWPSSSPPEPPIGYRGSGSGGSGSAALAAVRGNMQAVWSMQGGGMGSGGAGNGAMVHAAAPASSVPPGPEATTQCTPSSVSEVSEDCGVHGPPDLETTLEAMLSYGEHASEPHYARAAAAAAQKSFAAAAAAAPVPGAPAAFGGHEAVLGGMHSDPPIGAGSKALAAAAAAAASSGRVMTGWAAVAAKDPNGVARAAAPPALAPGSEVPGTAAAAAAAWRQAVAAGGGSIPPGLPFQAASGPSTTPAPPQGPRLFPKLSPRLRDEIIQLVHTVPGLKVEDFDEGVLYQLGQKRNEDEAIAALRTLLGSEVTSLQHPAAYLNHVIKNFHSGGSSAEGSNGNGAPSLPSATVRANSVPMSSKTILQRLPLRVYRRLEDIVHNCPHLEWKHFDAGVVKVLSQLAELSDDDVMEELELLQSTDLSAVEYMPAYLNKRLNNRLWSKRKQQHARQGS